MIRWIPLAFLVAMLMLGTEPGQAQNTSPAGGASERFIGAWDLVDWRTTDGTGAVRFPYGEGAQGQVTYSLDGRMSAHLMRPPENGADAPSQYLSYWGTFSVDPTARTVTHHVIGSDQRNWIGSDQVRGYEFQSEDRLVLSLGSNRLTWVRARPGATPPN